MLHVNFLQYYFNHHILEENKIETRCHSNLGVPNLPKLLKISRP